MRPTQAETLTPEQEIDTMTPTTEIETFTTETGSDFYCVWFWVDGNCVHVGHFDSEWQAQRASQAVMEAVELTRHAIRKLI